MQSHTPSNTGSPKRCTCGAIGPATEQREPLPQTPLRKRLLFFLDDGSYADLDAAMVYRAPRPEHLSPQQRTFLVALAMAKGNCIPSARLQCVYQIVDTVRTVRLLRQALGDDCGAPRYVITVPRQGYRLAMPELVRYRVLLLADDDDFAPDSLSPGTAAA